MRFLLLDKTKVYVPGHNVDRVSENTIVINSLPYIQSYITSDYYIDILDNTIDLTTFSNTLTKRFIELQIPIVLKEILDDKIEYNGNINLTSIGMVELLVGIEEQFGLSIPIENLQKNSFENVRYLADLIYNTIKGETQ